MPITSGTQYIFAFRPGLDQVLFKVSAGSAGDGFYGVTATIVNRYTLTSSAATSTDPVSTSSAPGLGPSSSTRVLTTQESPTVTSSAMLSTTATTTTLAHDGTCDGVKDGDIVCRSPNTFNFCVGGKFVMAESQRCADGTVCCKETNKCDFAFNCPSFPKDTADRCYGKSDTSIICTAPDKFKICSSGRSNLTPEMSCQPGLFCCETLNRCDTSCPQQPPPVQPLPTSTQAPPLPPGPTVPPPGPGPTNCAGQGDGNIVCKTLKTFNFCINGQFLTSPCPEGTVCCASSQSCDFQFNCKSVRPTAVNPPPASNPAPVSGAPVPTILPATCQGRPNGSIICRSGTTFNFCIDNGAELPSGNRMLPGQKHMRLCQQLSAGCCGSSAIAVALALTLAFRSTRAVVSKPCASDFHKNGQPHEHGTVRATDPVRCILPGNCPDPVPTSPASIAPPQPTSIFNRYCGASYTGLKCTSKTTFNFCEAGILNAAQDQTCAGGLVCCPTLGACTFEAQCPIAVGAAAQDYVPPVPAYTGQGVAAKVCNGVLDGAVICLTDKEFNYCLSDAFLYEKPMACPTDTVCCIHTNRCEWAWNCKPKSAAPSPPVVAVSVAEAVAFGSCIGFAAGGTTCVSETDFVYCNENGLLLPLIRKTCVAGSVCCASTGVCQLPDSCPEATPSLPPGPPAPIAVTEPSPTPGDGNKVAEPSASIATRCEKADMNTLFCRDETQYEVCTGEGTSVRGLCAPGTICCPRTNSCNFASAC
ncbi:hypothetical protein HDU96_005079 [Phlyctochytrium bullatum]|nr:hypothetical protein HDU96_005079 [Phlyctochytrium bullatum]